MTKNCILLWLSLFLPLGVFSQIFQDQKIVTSDRADSDQLGTAIAIDGNYAVIGVRNEDEDALGGNTLISAGSAYVYVRNSSGVWIETQKIVASDRASTDQFGYAVAISGKYLAVGARQEDENASGSGTLNNSGSVYIFERNGSGVWNEIQKIVPSDRADNDRFGETLSMSGDYLVVGAPYEDEDASGGNTVIDAGSVYVFQNNGSGTWNEVQKIVATNRDSYDNFGIALYIHRDYIAVGTPYEDHDASGGSFQNLSGSAYIFKKDIYDSWQLEQKIVADDRTSSSFFGNSIALSDNYLVVGAPFERRDASGSNSLTQAGAAYVFEKLADGTWQQAQKIVASDREASDQFGSSIDISGSYIVLGAHNEDHDASGGNALNNAGAAYLFKSDAAGLWSQQQKIVASDRASADSFGKRIVISGANIMVTADLEDEDAAGGNTLNNSGSAYLFTRNEISYASGVWTGGSGASNEPTSADGEKSIIISNGAASITGDVEASDVTVRFGASLTVTENSTLTVAGAIRLPAQSLTIESSASGTGSLVNLGDFIYETINGGVKAKRYIHQNGNGSNALLTYHYIGTPVDNHAKFTDMADSDLYAYRESDLTWLYHEDFTDGFENFNKGVGYAIRYNTAVTKEFTGQVTNENFQVEVTLSDNGGSVFEGFNILANPYPCALDAGNFISENSSVLASNVYFWNGLDYATYNTALSSGTAGAMGPVPDGNIALGQAFAVEATTSGTQMVNFTRAMRTDETPQFYKKASYPQLRLQITSETEQSDVLLTGHHLSSNATDRYDAKQLEGSSRLSLGTVLYGRAYAIESVPELSGHEFDLVVKTTTPKSITFQINDLIGLEGKQVYLEDREKGVVSNLSKNSYSTYIKAGEDSDRFKLRVAVDQSDYYIWVNDGKVMVYKGEERLNGTITIYGLDGRLLAVSDTNEINNWHSFPIGVYLLTIENEQESYTSKIIKQ